MFFFDPLYGRIDIASFCEPFINSPYFRRLRYLRQLGLCYLSFPGGNHTRFEHSLGTFHLARLVSDSLEHPGIGSASEIDRLKRMITIAALCHDIGHGPFSHMTENVINGLGSSLSHEEIGAAIITHRMNDAFDPVDSYDIKPELIGCIMTKSPHPDSMIGSAASIISSDLDVDRLDFLYRDSHYSGLDFPSNSVLTEIEDVWRLRNQSGRFYIELTDNGVRLAEQALFLRRRNYHRIVFESRHMAATGMFEKAVFAAYNFSCPFSDKLRSVMSISMDWRDRSSVDENLPGLLKIYGMVDYEALHELEQSCSDSRYLIQRIRTARLFRPVATFRWDAIHHQSKQKMLTAKSKHDIFMLRRSLEFSLARSCKVDEKHVVVHVPAIKMPLQMVTGVEGGGTLEDNSELGRFFHGDYLRQYKVEIFVDMQVDSESTARLTTTAKKIFQNGALNRLEVYPNAC